MSVGRRKSGVFGMTAWPQFPGQQATGVPGGPAPTPDVIQRLAAALLSTYRGPHVDAPGTITTGPIAVTAPEQLVSEGAVAAHYQLGARRGAGETNVAVYPGDAESGPALQIVTDQAAMLVDSVTVLLHRLGIAYTAIMNPVFRVRRDADGQLVDIRPVADAA